MTDPGVIDMRGPAVLLTEQIDEIAAGAQAATRLLVVEDDPALREAEQLILQRAGFVVDVAARGDDARNAFVGGEYAAVLADLMLPGLDGLTLLREIRSRSSVPVIVVTARTETATLVTALELGADDYVTKPFEALELVARIRALLRRVAGASEEVLRLGDLEVDTGRFCVRKAGHEVQVSATEVRLLAELLRARGRALTREELLERVWKCSYLGDSRLVDMAVKRLRDRVEDVPSHPRYVLTVRGVGYRAGR